MGMHIIIAGNPLEGFMYYGPYKTSEDADRARDEAIDRGWFSDAWIAPLQALEVEA